MAITETQARYAKPREKPYKIPDAFGLYLLIAITGSKYWRWKYYFEGKEKLSSFGVYPIVGIAQAREMRDAGRKLLANGIDPSAYKKQKKAA